MEEENLQPTRPDDATQPQEESAEERRFAQIMQRVALGARLSNSPIAAADCFRGGV